MTEESNYRGNEMWKQHPTLPIQVSTLGRVRMGDRILKIRRYPNPRLRGYGYGHVSVTGHGRHHLHRLVAQTWIKPDLNSNDCVCHKDETVDPEFLDTLFNLWIGTKSENSKDRHSKGRSSGGYPIKYSLELRRRVLALRKLGLYSPEIVDLLNVDMGYVQNQFRCEDTNHYINEGGI